LKGIWSNTGQSSKFYWIKFFDFSVFIHLPSLLEGDIMH